jgi:hypothetical protein
MSHKNRLSLIGLALSCLINLWSVAVSHGQVVQLPVVRQFSITGGALIPDQGTGYLGGNNYRSSGTVSRGPVLSNRTMGSITGGSQVSASVQIIDLAALDEAILNSAVSASEIASQSKRTAAVSDQAAADKARRFLTAHSTYREPQARNGDPSYRDFNSTLGSSTDKVNVDPSLAESNVRHYLRLGQEAERANRIQSARVYYRLAVEAMTPELMDRYQRVIAEKSKADEAEKKSKPARRQF